MGLRKRSLNLVASVNGKGITKETYYKEMQRFYQVLRNSLGKNFNDEAIKGLNLEQMVLNTLIEREILFQEAKRQKIRITDQELQKKIKSLADFQKEGKFDMETYRALLDWSGYTPQKFEKELLRDMSINKLKDAILEGIKLSEEEIRDEYRQKNEEVEIGYCLITPDNNLEIQDKEIEEYYQEHKEDYRIPEKIKVRHILINPEGARKTIKEINTRLKREESFPELAKEFSQCPSKENGGDLGFIKRGDMVEEFEKAAFKLKEEQVSRAVKSRFGYHLIKVELRKEGYLPPLDDLRERIRKELQVQKGWEVAEEKAQEIAQEASKDNLVNVARKSSLEVKRSGLCKRGESNLPRQIESEAFDLKTGEVKGPLKDRDGYYIIEVLRQEEIDEEKFLQEKEAFTKALLETKKAIKYREWSQKLYQKAKIKTYS
jgi:peptidyl-prolyl cis-trans isomerase D